MHTFHNSLSVLLAGSLLCQNKILYKWNRVITVLQYIHKYTYFNVLIDFEPLWYVIYLLYKSNSCTRSFLSQAFALLSVTGILHGSQLYPFLLQIH